ncbi:MarR family winged helix-turn-helix transcriptional regulator [Risungbinella massiliensis]|uniref:MarR family winged helix-turn-helix transcriptional regulator n=1 Tax=Risungbinella massiliensis TaxID=1329796 RepID=UPI0005CC3BFA|nr:MarR family transcriptional regulator [Risungbinella massiliensis]
MENENLRLDNHLCFTIYACSREITKLYRPLLAELGITYPQYLVLQVLFEHGECTVKELGQILYLDSGTLTPLLKRMEEMNLVKRNRRKEDERVVSIQLSDSGVDVHKKACKVPMNLFNKSGVEPEEFTKLLAQMKKLLQSVHDANQGT